MDPSLFAAFVVVDLMIVVTPCADWAYAITAGVAGAASCPPSPAWPAVISCTPRSWS
jgi:hypothetical protein